MLIPTKDSLAELTEEILNKDYINEPDATLTTELVYENVLSDLELPPLNPKVAVRVLKSNYVEPTKKLQSAYELQFRGFSGRRSNKDTDDFESLI